MSVEDGNRLDGDEERVARSLAALDRLADLRDRIAREFPPPEDELTAAEAIRRDREERMDQIEAAVRLRKRPPGRRAS